MEYLVLTVLLLTTIVNSQGVLKKPNIYDVDIKSPAHMYYEKDTGIDRQEYLELETLPKTGTTRDFEDKRKGLLDYILHNRSKRDDDYDDEGGFVSAAGHSGDDDFIANIRECASGFTRAPWGKCITCAEYKTKLRRLGMGC